MPQIQSQIITKNPNPLTQPYATHEDIYGKGGYVAIATNTENPNINSYIIEQRRKVGMMVYDITLDKFYICDNVLPSSDDDDNWTPVAFGGTDGGGATALSELTDVSLDLQLEDDNILIYDSSAEKWKNIDLLTHFNFPVNTAGELDIATNTSIEILIDIINNLELIANIEAGTGISVVTDTNNVSTISLNATLGNLTNVNDDVDSLGKNGENYVLKWDRDEEEWVAGPVSIIVEGSTDGVFAQYNEPFVLWNQSADLPEALVLSNLLTPGYGITIETGTNQSFIFSLDQNIVVLYEDMPQYTDGSLDVARQSTLESLVDLLNSFGTTDCPVGGGGILEIQAGTNINITGTSSIRTINLDSTVSNTGFTSCTYNGLSIERQPQTEKLLLTYLDSGGQANISITFSESFGATFTTENPGLNLFFRDVNTGQAEYEQKVAYLDDLYLSKLYDVVIETDLVPGSILTYVDDGSQQYWTNTNEINGGSADSFF